MIKYNVSLEGYPDRSYSEYIFKDLIIITTNSSATFNYIGSVKLKECKFMQLRWSSYRIEDNNSSFIIKYASYNNINLLKKQQQEILHKEKGEWI